MLKKKKSDNAILYSKRTLSINIFYYLVQNLFKECKSSLCSVLYLTLKDKLFCTLYKIIKVGAENASCKVSNHMPKSSPPLLRSQNAIQLSPRGTLLALGFPGAHSFSMAEMLLFAGYATI